MNAKTPTRNRINAHDAEDMTKIILDDAIKAEQERIERLKLPKALSFWDLREKVAQIAIKGCIRMRENLKLVTAKDGSGRAAAFNYGSVKMDKDAESVNSGVVILVDEKVFAKTLAAVEENRAIEARKEVEKAHLEKLKERRQNYKDIAARFRLGFTGNPNDIDDVNSKAKAYLLAREA